MTPTLKVDLARFGRPDIKFLMAYDALFTQTRALVECLDKLGTCEPDMTYTMLRIIRPGDVVADVGASIGFFTVLMSKLVGPNGMVYSFEPDERNLPRLQENLDLNKCDNVTVVTAPAFSHHAVLPFSLAKDSGESSLGPVQVLHKLVDLETCVLDDYPDLTTASFVKVDAEGAEHAVMRGADSLLVSRVPFVAMEMSEKILQAANTSRQLVREHMAGYGYDGWLMQHNGALPWFIPLHTRLEGGKPNLCMLFAETRSIEAHWTKVELVP